MSLRTRYTSLMMALGALAFFNAVNSSIAVSAQQATTAPPMPPMPDVQKLGPQVGARVPDFTLTDQNGKTRTLASLMGPKGLMLLFYRSADWCPYCKTQLAELQARVGDLNREGLGLAAISYDAVPVIADFAKRRNITYPLLSDPGSTVIKRYGIFNTTIDETNTQSYGIPFPGTFVVSPAGLVTARFFEQAYQERTTVASILARVSGGPGARAAQASGRMNLTRIAGPQVNITAYLTDETVAPGTHFSVVLDVTPAEGTHVYAPGVTGYKPMTLSIQPQAGLVVRESLYPKAEDYFFKPLNEHVAVYQKPFRVVQDLMIDASTQGQTALRGMTSLTLQGSLSYQACDDKICFAPQVLPLTWTVTLGQLDRERVGR